MKKIFISILLSLVLVIMPFTLTGCNKDYSKENVASLYSSMLNNENTKNLFNGNFIDINFDEESINLVSTDKSYIFPLVYDYYISASSQLLFGVINRITNNGGNVEYVFKDFNQKQLNDIYSKMLTVSNNLNILSESKEIFEISNGNLHYKKLINDYNCLISSLYDLNITFANYYFVENIAKTDFAIQELSDNNIRDMLSFQLMLISRISYNYDLLNFVTSNPIGSVTTWYNKTVFLKNFVEGIAKDLLLVLSGSNSLVPSSTTTQENLKELFTSMQLQQQEFDNEYNNFCKALTVFNVKAFESAVNKNAYLEALSNREKSCYQIIQNFANGRYAAFYDGLIMAENYV